MAVTFKKVKTEAWKPQPCPVRSAHGEQMGVRATGACELSSLGPTFQCCD